MTVALSLPSFAKINLHLQVVGRRPDGFHDLCTVFQTISLHDTLTISPSESDDVVMTCGDDRIPVGDKNLVVRAAMALQEDCKVRCGARIHLDKLIPAPGGLGGGSSNAAVALLGLNKVWNLGRTLEELHPIWKLNSPSENRSVLAFPRSQLICAQISFASAGCAFPEKTFTLPVTLINGQQTSVC